MKTLKIIIGAVVALLLVLVILVLALPLWFGAVARPCARAVVPNMTKTEFDFSQIALNPYTGHFELANLQLGNPEGYSEKYAVTLGKVVVDVAMETVTKSTVRIREITVDDLTVTYTRHKNVSNFDQIKYNVAGGKEQYEAQEAAKNEAESAAPEEASAPEPGKKFVIDRFTLRGFKANLGFLPIALPTITLTDIGKESDGVTLEDIYNTILEAVLKALGAAGDGLKALGGVLGDGAKALKLDAASDAAVEHVGNAAGKAVDAASGVAEDATKLIKGLFK